MTLITDSERIDFEQCIVVANLSIDDFELTERRDAGGPKEGYFPTGTVTVTYTPTGISRTYEVSTWSADFEDDLKSNAFKTR